MKKLLFITQKVDKDDDILGVYHRWVEELSKRVGKINVICLYRGRVDLPPNVSVYSLGKEDRNLELGTWNLEQFFWKLKYIVRFYRYIWRLRHEYDMVFVHMNPIYVVLGGLFWKLNGKKMFLWYNHPLGNLTARIGIKLADKVFCTSPYAFSAKYKKTFLMPVGVDTNFFKPMLEVSKNSKQILYLGRISPIKKIEYLTEAVRLLDERGLDFKVLIIGSPGPGVADKEYEAELKEVSAGLMSRHKVEFKPAVPYRLTPEIYNGNGIFVNLTPSGSFDKVILEAMACGVLPLVSNKSLTDVLPPDLQALCMFNEGSPSSLADKLVVLLDLSSERKPHLAVMLRDIVIRSHSLDTLVLRLFHIFDGERQ